MSGKKRIFKTNGIGAVCTIAGADTAAKAYNLNTLEKKLEATSHSNVTERTELKKQLNEAGTALGEGVVRNASIAMAGIIAVLAVEPYLHSSK